MIVAVTKMVVVIVTVVAKLTVANGSCHGKCVSYSDGGSHSNCSSYGNGSSHGNSSSQVNYTCSSDCEGSSHGNGSCQEYPWSTIDSLDSPDEKINVFENCLPIYI